MVRRAASRCTRCKGLQNGMRGIQHYIDGSMPPPRHVLELTPQKTHKKVDRTTGVVTDRSSICMLNTGKKDPLCAPLSCSAKYDIEGSCECRQHGSYRPHHNPKAPADAPLSWCHHMGCTAFASFDPSTLQYSACTFKCVWRGSNCVRQYNLKSGTQIHEEKHLTSVFLEVGLFVLYNKNNNNNIDTPWSIYIYI